jgi:pyridoxamine 5'-phosphate oxidase
MKDLSNCRKSYGKSELLESAIPDDPINLFNRWFYEAMEIGCGEVNAMTVSTIGTDGFPKSRVVLLKKFSEEGFIFFSNYHSEKGKAIAANPNVCLSFFWPVAEQQIIIKGRAEKTNITVSDNYFDSRPKGSRLGAIVSNQSDVIPSREFIENKLHELENNLQEDQIRRPEQWGGYLVKPSEIEFWQGRDNRLHDRIRYRLSAQWVIERLAP